MFEYKIYVEDDHFYLKIVGYKGEKIDEKNFYRVIEQVSKTTKVNMIVVNPDVLPSPLNLVIAVKYALRSFKQERNISEKFPIETLLFLSGKKEINKVLETFSPRGKIEMFIICFISKDKLSILKAMKLLKNRLNIKEERSLFNLNETKIKKILNTYGISDEEIKSYHLGNIDQILKYAVATRSALLALKM